MGSNCSTEQKSLSFERCENKTYISIEDADAVIRDLEKRGEIEAKKVLQTDVKEAADQLIGFMEAGAKEFEQRSGRRMTYSEMRAAWG